MYIHVLKVKDRHLYFHADIEQHVDLSYSPMKSYFRFLCTLLVDVTFKYNNLKKSLPQSSRGLILDGAHYLQVSDVPWQHVKLLAR